MKTCRRRFSAGGGILRWCVLIVRSGTRVADAALLPQDHRRDAP